MIQETFEIQREFTLMYQDQDFDGQFFTLSSIHNVQDKATLKLVFPQPIVLTLSTVYVQSSALEQCSHSISSQSSGSHDTIILSSDESAPSHRSQAWPKKFPIPAFSYDVDVILEAGNEAYKSNGTLLNNPK